MSAPEHTGSHLIPPPPALPTLPSSEPPISKRGVSWKLVGAFLALLMTVGASALGISNQIGESAAEERARDRATSQQIEQLTREVRVIGGTLVTHREQLTAHRERIGTLRRDVDELERDRNKRRPIDREN
jgi:septal ring factor EnvC (AmiA/AmiB activator)